MGLLELDGRLPVVEGSSEIDVSKVVERGFGVADLLALAERFDVAEFDADFLPGKETVMGSPTERKNAIFGLAEKIWRLSSEDWLEFEGEMLAKQREMSGSSTTGGKEKTSQVVSAEIAVRVLAACRVVSEYGPYNDVSVAAVEGLNAFLEPVVLKGRLRGKMVEDKNTRKKRSVYDVLRDGGVSVGPVGVKYLPFPEEALPVILSLFDRSKVRDEVYVSE